MVESYFGVKRVKAKINNDKNEISEKLYEMKILLHPRVSRLK